MYKFSVNWLAAFGLMSVVIVLLHVALEMPLQARSFLWTAIGVTIGLLIEFYTRRA